MISAREFNGYLTRFQRKTGVDLWKAVQDNGFSLGFFFDTFDDLVELSKEDPETFDILVSKLIKLYKSKDSTISDRRIVYAIAISLYNTHLDTRRKKVEESYISSIYVSQDSARDIVSQYGQAMSNPVAMIVNPGMIHESILRGRHLDQPVIHVRNGQTSRGRVVGGLASPRKFNLLEIESIDVMAYHPTVWHLLKDKTLGEHSHLFSKSIQLCETWISNSTRKRQRTLEE